MSWPRARSLGPTCARLIVLVVLAATVAPAAALGQFAKTDAGTERDAASDSVLFDQVEPILRDRCWRCHGPDHQSAALRLDKRDLAITGGGSGKNLLALPLESNELLRRVKSTKEGERMPIEGPPLTSQEIATLEKWIAAGAPWREPPKVELPVQSLPEPETDWFNRLLDAWERYDGRQLIAPGYVLLSLLLAMLAVEQLKKRRAAGKLNPAGRGGQLALWLTGLSRASYLAGAMAVVIYMLAAWCWNLHQRVLEQDRQLAEASAARFAAAPSNPGSPQGPQRAVLRAKHPPRLGGLYYRGNDERSPKLFNGGFYRTATLDLSLRDASGERLKVGDSITSAMSIRLEIVRAPHTTPALFTAEVMKSIFLCAVPPDQLPAPPGSWIVRLQVLEPDQAWAVEQPLGPPPADGRWTGQLFLYSGYSEDPMGQINGAGQYTIGYNLRAVDGRLAEDCNLWLGSVNNGLRLHWPEEGTILPSEWFDFRPIPEIVGENTDDPKLLGIEEHLKEGASLETTGPTPQQDE